VITDLPLVIVRWDDAQSSSVKVITENDPVTNYHAPAVMETLGWLLRDDEKGVSIANEVYRDEGVRHYRGHTFIPRGMNPIVTNVSVKRSQKRAKPRPSQAVPPGDVSEVSEPDRSQGR
jgi:hypothetical protein